MVAALLFDMDGTIVDNMRFHAEAWMTMSARLGVGGMTLYDFEQKFAGKKNEEILPLLLQRALSTDEVREMAHEKESLYRETYKAHLKATAGFIALLDAADAAGIPCAVASAAPIENRDFVLDGLQLRARFRAIVGAEHVARGKPHPDLFLAAAKAVGAEPTRCIAFEDAVLGVQSAVAAGMRCVGLTTVAPAAALRAAGAIETHATFETITLSALR
jgi:beta-phosphoglucomutase